MNRLFMNILQIYIDKINNIIYTGQRQVVPVNPAPVVPVPVI